MIPWIKIITTGASLAEIAKDLYLTAKRDKKELAQPGQPTIPELQVQIKQLEENELRQASLISKMAEQQRIFSKRLFVSYIISISSAVLAILSVLLHFWK